MRKLVILLSAVALAACASSKQASTASSSSSNAVVFKGSELSGSILDGLRHRYTAMTVTQGTGNCPMIVFRGRLSGRNQNNPSVYVDRTLMSDTCILQSIYANDVDRVEIYPGGNVTDPAIQRNPFGVIMIYRLKN